jgi:hypothetical protein
VTLTNNGGFLLNGLTFAVADTTADATANEYAITGSTCPSDHTLGVGSTCQITVSFTPSQAGVRNGSFTASAANLSAPLTVALTGTVEDFQIEVSSANSATIVNGQTATYQVQILPVNGSTGSVSLSCTGAPQNSTCTLSPAMTSLAVPEFSTVTVATGVGGTGSGDASTAYLAENRDNTRCAAAVRVFRGAQTPGSAARVADWLRYAGTDVACRLRHARVWRIYVNAHRSAGSNDALRRLHDQYHRIHTRPAAERAG